MQDTQQPFKAQPQTTQNLGTPKETALITRGEKKSIKEKEPKQSYL